MAYGGYLLISNQLHTDQRRATVEKFVAGLGEGRPRRRCTRLLDAPSRKANPEISFLADYRRANQAAGVEKITIGTVGPLLSGGIVRVPVSVKTKDFGTLKGTLKFHATQTDDIAPRRLVAGAGAPGPARGRGGPPPQRRGAQARQHLRRRRPAAELRPDGRLDRRRPRARSRPGSSASTTTAWAGAAARRCASATAWSRACTGRRGRSVNTTIRLGLQKTAQAALGGKLGGIAVIKPSDGSVLALAGIAVSAPQPPGSSFKIITAAAALQEGVAKPSSTYPVRTSATLSGVKLRNASDEQCGGSLSTSFAHSCNSVFGPIGAKLGAKKLVAAAERFGFNEELEVPAAKMNTIPAAKDLKDSLAVGASAIGQNKDLATPLGMASVGATIANHGVRVRPHIAGSKRVRKRAVSAKVAGQVRDMMIAVVRGGTGHRGVDPGRHRRRQDRHRRAASRPPTPRRTRRTRRRGSSPSRPPTTRRSRSP